MKDRIWRRVVLASVSAVVVVATGVRKSCRRRPGRYAGVMP
jgi:hypothetical protein